MTDPKHTMIPGEAEIRARYERAMKSCDRQELWGFVMIVVGQTILLISLGAMFK